jgi:glycosyltransferase involved in cell wall biosynthesis
MEQSSNLRVPVSVVVPIRNEAENLDRCLSSVAWADEIFVVDSASTDGSAAIAERHGARVVQFQFNGTWPKKKNWALQNLPFRNEWVLILDADEVLPPEAGAEINEAVSTEDPGSAPVPGAGESVPLSRTLTGTSAFRRDAETNARDARAPQKENAPDEIAGYWINRRFFFLGRWLRHSYYPNWNLRLFRHAQGRYERLTEAETKSGDNEVHEHVVVQGPTARLRCEMDHYAFPSVEVFIEKHNRYSNWEARVAVDGLLPQSAGELSHRRVERRRRLKLLSQRLPFRPLLRFLYIFVWQKGFLDGRDGYYFARLHATYEFLSVVKTYELRRRGETPKA